MNPLRKPLFVLAALLPFIAASLVLAQDSSTPASSLSTTGAPPSSNPDLAPPPPPPPPPPRLEPVSPASRLGPGRGYAPPQMMPIQMYQDQSQAIWISEGQMNNYYVNKFILTARFGAARMTVPTMTLDLSLRLVLRKEVKLDGAIITAVDSYRIDKLELIGIAKHDIPVAFVVNRHSAFIPMGLARVASGYSSRFDTPATTTGVRPLTDFEKSALVDIIAGKDISIQLQSDGSRLVVGAVRAQAACIQCHDTYKVGDALGAFSYHLTKASLFDNIPPSTDNLVSPLSMPLRPSP